MNSNRWALHSSVIETFQCMLVNANFFASVFFCVQNVCCKNVFKTQRALIAQNNPKQSYSRKIDYKSCHIHKGGKWPIDLISTNSYASAVARKNGESLMPFLQGTAHQVKTPIVAMQHATPY